MGNYKGPYMNLLCIKSRSNSKNCRQTTTSIRADVVLQPLNALNPVAVCGFATVNSLRPSNPKPGKNPPFSPQSNTLRLKNKRKN